MMIRYLILLLIFGVSVVNARQLQLFSDIFRPSSRTDGCHLRVRGRFLYDANGEKVIMRAIENVIRYGDYNGSGEWNDPYENGSLIDGNGDNVVEVAKNWCQRNSLNRWSP